MFCGIPPIVLFETAQYSKNVVKNATEREIIISLSLLSTLGSSAACSHPSLPEGHKADLCFPLWFTRTLRGFWQSCFLASLSPLQIFLWSYSVQDAGLHTCHSELQEAPERPFIPPAYLPSTWSHPQPCWGHSLCHCWLMKTSSSVGPIVCPSDIARNWPLVGLCHWPPSFESRMQSLSHPQWPFF